MMAVALNAKYCKKGFTLMEVLTAVLIMSMMMIAVISFIDYTSTIWRTGQTTVNSKNYSRMFFDLLNQELLNTDEIVKPEKNENDNSGASFLLFNSVNTPKYRSIYFEEDEHKIYLIKTDDNNFFENSGKPKNKPNEKILLANNVKELHIKHQTNSTIEVNLIIQSDEEDEEGEHDIISNDTMILYAPMVRQE